MRRSGRLAKESTRLRRGALGAKFFLVSFFVPVVKAATEERLLWKIEEQVRTGCAPGFDRASHREAD